MITEPPPRPLEIALGTVWGPAADERPAAAGTPDAADASATSPRAALEAIAERALRAGTCMVSFSGGRDSSTILAIAVHVARRASLPLPVPVTLRFAHDPLSDESAWQERVLAHLGVRERVVLELTDELDIVGPCAQRILMRFGPMWPFNVHFHVPMADRARGGVLLTGIGGDELLGRTTAMRVQAVLRGRARPTLRDACRAAYVYAPRTLRARVIRRRGPTADWLRPAAAQDAARGRAAWSSAMPARWDRSVTQWWAQSRMHACALDACAAIGDVTGATVISPLLDRTFLAAMAARHGATGPASRTAAVRELAGDLLPDDLLARGSKAGFLTSFWGPGAAAFGGGWNGEGVDPQIVDVDALRAQWQAPVPAHAATFLLLQAAWVAAQGGPTSCDTASR